MRLVEVLEIQASTGPSLSGVVDGTGRSMNWRWPPSRCGGTTILRAIAVATEVPSSVRTRCSAASMPAAVPALVMTVPSCT